MSLTVTEIQLRDAMEYQYEVTLINCLSGYNYKTYNLTLVSGCADYETAIATFVSKREEYHNCLVINPKTKTPMIFKAYAQKVGSDGHSILTPASACTFKKFKDISDFMVDTYKYSFTQKPLACVELTSFSGKAGAYFEMEQEIAPNMTYCDGDLF